MSFADLTGQTRSVAEFEGKVVLLDFWATWCGPCRASLPLYDQWQTELGDDFVVIAVSVDDRVDPVPRFAKQYMPSVEVWHDAEHQGAAALDLPAMPTAFVVDRSGQIVFTHVGFDINDADAMKAEITALMAL
jgi:thiol-disulfide isomerase/thioredoxin